MANTTDQDSLERKLYDSRIWRSIFRYGYPIDRRNRINDGCEECLPAPPPEPSCREGAVKLTYTWCLGGLSFMMFLILTVTGVLLMFYYVPSVERGVPGHQGHGDGHHLWDAHAEHASLGAAHGMVITVCSCTCVASSIPARTNRRGSSTGCGGG